MILTKRKLDTALDKAEGALIARGVLDATGGSDPDVLKLLEFYSKLIEDIVEVDV
jgi:hypothetical protein